MPDEASSFENDENLDRRLAQLEEQIASIQERNHQIKADKAWEVSLTRKLAIAILTYALVSLVFYVIGIERFFINAIIPTLGYYLSTQTFPLIKSYWIKVRIK